MRLLLKCHCKHKADYYSRNIKLNCSICKSINIHLYRKYLYTNSSRVKIKKNISSQIKSNPRCTHYPCTYLAAVKTNDLRPRKIEIADAAEKMRTPIYIHRYLRLYAYAQIGKGERKGTEGLDHSIITRLIGFLSSWPIAAARGTISAAAAALRLVKPIWAFLGQEREGNGGQAPNRREKEIGGLIYGSTGYRPVVASLTPRMHTRG